MYPRYDARSASRPAAQRRPRTYLLCAVILLVLALIFVPTFMFVSGVGRARKGRRRKSSIYDSNIHLRNSLLNQIRGGASRGGWQYDVGAVFAAFPYVADQPLALQNCQWFGEDADFDAENGDALRVDNMTLFLMQRQKEHAEKDRNARLVAQSRHAAACKTKWTENCTSTTTFAATTMRTTTTTTAAIKKAATNGNTTNSDPDANRNSRPTRPLPVWCRTWNAWGTVHRSIPPPPPPPTSRAPNATFASSATLYPTQIFKTTTIAATTATTTASPTSQKKKSIHYFEGGRVIFDRGLPRSARLDELGSEVLQRHFLNVIFEVKSMCEIYNFRAYSSLFPPAEETIDSAEQQQQQQQHPNNDPITSVSVNTAGCRRVNAGTLVATRFFNVFDQKKYEEVFHSIADGDDANDERQIRDMRRCLREERRRVVDVMNILWNEGRNNQRSLLEQYTTLRRMWIPRDEDVVARQVFRDVEMRYERKAVPPRRNLSAPTTTYEPWPPQTSSTTMTTTAGANPAATAGSASPNTRRSTRSPPPPPPPHLPPPPPPKRAPPAKQAPPPPPQTPAPEPLETEAPPLSPDAAAVILRRFPPLPFHKRQRILMVASLRRKDLGAKVGPVYGYEDALRSFLMVARPETDKLVVMTDYRIMEWKAFLDGLCREESQRRHRLRKQLRKHRLWRTIKMREALLGDNDTTRQRRQRHVSGGDEDHLVGSALDDEQQYSGESNVNLAAKIEILDVDQLDLVWEPLRSEPPLNSRVWIERHVLKYVKQHEWRDDTVSMIIFSDFRDVVYQRNIFDAVEELNLNRHNSSSSSSGSVSSSPPSTSADTEEGEVVAVRGRIRNQFYGVFAAAEDNSHQCNRLGTPGSSTPRWEDTIVGSTAMDRAAKCRLLPDRSLMPILCSGYMGGSVSAMRDWTELHLRTLHAHDWKDPWGVDQGAASVAWMVGLSASGFRHDMYLLHSLNPVVRHMHYFDADIHAILASKSVAPYLDVEDEQQLFYPRGLVYMDCAGFGAIAALHQIDRKTRIYSAWRQMMLNESFENKLHRRLD